MAGDRRWLPVACFALVLAQGTQCQPETPKPVPSHERQFHAIRTEEITVQHARWRFYVFRHASGACYVVVRPSGEGGGAITQTDQSVCARAEQAAPLE